MENTTSTITVELGPVSGGAVPFTATFDKEFRAEGTISDGHAVIGHNPGLSRDLIRAVVEYAYNGGI